MMSPPTDRPRKSRLPAAALRFSLAANVVLLTVIALLLSSRSRDAAAPDGAPDDAGQATSAAPPRSAEPPTGPAWESSARIGITPATLAMLEQLGLSRDVVVNAALESFERRWDEHFAALEDRYAPRAVPEREYIELGRLRDAARLRELISMLGEDGYRAWDRARILRLLNAGRISLSAAEADTIHRVQKDFEEQHRELQMAMEDGIADMADASAMQRQAGEARDRALEQLLGRERLDAMRGLSDPVADVYRRLGDLAPTPVQVREVLEIDGRHAASEAALAARIRSAPADAISIAAELENLAREREDGLRRVFGAEAYASAARANDPTYRRLMQFAQTWELQAHEIAPVYETLRAFHDRAERARHAASLSEGAGQAVDWRAVRAGIEAERSQTEAALRSMIGEARLMRLKQNDMLHLR